MAFGGPTMVPLALASVLALTLILSASWPFVPSGCCPRRYGS